MSVMMASALVIEITQQDILLGRRNEASCCPIARALTRLGYKSVNVWGTYLSLLDPETDDVLFLDLPKPVQIFIKNFDKDRSVEPCTLTLTCDD